MTEGIEYNGEGTIDVTFDGTTYHLGRPKLRQWKYFTGQIEKMTTKAQATVQELSQAAAEAATAYEADENPDTRKALDKANAKLEAFAKTPFYETSSELIREMFQQMADQPLPDDIEDWPAWLATDVSLASQILTHWRKAPKASGAPPPT